MSWYRTYRPQTVAGLHIASVRSAFQSILDTGSFSHAYLLYGPKGTGKTSGARILAKVLNCEKNAAVVQAALSGKSVKGSKLVEPCNTCASCVAITSGSALCVTEMDAASNRGIDDIRLLTEGVGLSPGDGLVHVYIIDEVHMLTTEAFNALLKVLEEPPSHVVFILATTELHKVPATVASRTQVIPYRKALKEEVVAALQGIATSEKLEVEQAVYDRLVDLAEGSFRDAVKLFEQVASGSTTIGNDQVTAKLGSSVAVVVESLLQALGKKDADALVEVFKTISEQSLDGSVIQAKTIASLHARLVAAPAQKNPHLGSYIALLECLNIQSSPQLSVPWLPFELACFRWCLGNAQQSAPLPQPPVPSTPTPPKAPVRPAPARVATPTEMQMAAVSQEPVAPAPVSAEVAANTTTFDELIAKWHIVLRTLREGNNTLEGLFRRTKPVSLEQGMLTIETSYAFHKEQLMLERNIVIIEEILASVFYAKFRLTYTIAAAAVAVQAAPTQGIVASHGIDDAASALL